MRTYDYILAMKEESQSLEVLNFSDYSSDESSDFDDSPEKPSFMSRFTCTGRSITKYQNATRLSIRIDKESDSSSMNKPSFHASINPWKLIKMSKEKALLAAAKAKERIAKMNNPSIESESSTAPKPLPLETKCGPLTSLERKETPVAPEGWLSGTSRQFSSPRRRFSSSPTAFSGVAIASPKEKYRSNFDLKLTKMSMELETYISRQVLCSVLKKGGEELESPR